MTIVYKAVRRLVRLESGECIDQGTFFTTDGDYDPTDGTQEITTGNAIQNVSAAPDPILFRSGFLSGRSQAQLNVLIPHVIEVVDKYHSDYESLVKWGVIEDKPKKAVKTTDKGTD